jgi:hypothetical protein
MPLAKPSRSSTTDVSPLRGSYWSRRPVELNSRKSWNHRSKANLVLASQTVLSEASMAASANLAAERPTGGASADAAGVWVDGVRRMGLVVDGVDLMI